MTSSDGSPVSALAAIAIFVAVFALASLRRAHLGILMFSAASVVGVALADMPLREVVAGFPVGILVLVAGVTYFFGIAHLNGTLDRVMRALLARTGGSSRTLPVVFFGLAALTAAMGSPQAGLVTAPVGMPIARRAGVDSALMAIAINSGISAGAFAPTSLFGLVTTRIARDAGIALSPFTLLAVAVVANAVLLVVALAVFTRASHRTRAATRAAVGFDPIVATPEHNLEAPRHLTAPQVATVACLALLVASVVLGAVLGVEADLGVVALGLGAILMLIDPATGTRAFARIDWSTAFVVGGIVTFVAVLQKLGSVDVLGRAALGIGTPFVAAVGVCMIAALVSAFASTTAVLAALVPLAVPLATSGTVPGWALITALSVSATVVDASPFSNTGATLVASAAEDDRPRLRTLLLRWGLSMVLLGPLVLVPLLVFVGAR